MRFAHRLLTGISSIVLVGVALMMMTSPAEAQRRAAPVRRGAAGIPVKPTADVSISIGGAVYTARVDANCTRDERATATNGRFYYHIMYPWFGARPAAGQPEWRFGLDVVRPSRADAFEHFVFSFQDGSRSGTIQKLAKGERMGSGAVRVTRQGTGARLDVEGRSQNGDAIRATIECASFPASEGVGG